MKEARGAAAGAAEGPAPPYPPETYRYMSWSTVQFIQRPTWRPLAWACLGLLGIVAAALLVVPFIKVEARTPADGQIAADPGALPALAAAEGLLEAVLAAPGQQVRKGEVLARIEMGLPSERLRETLAALDRNTALVEKAGHAVPLGPGVESGLALAALREASLRDLAMSLNAAVGRLKTSLANQEPFVAHKSEVLQSSRRLRGALDEFLERHLVRAPASGTLLQYEAAPHAAVKAGQSVALVLPEDARLVARLYVEPRHAATLAVGQTVRHRLEAYPFQQYGLFEGEVLAVEQAVDPQRGLLYVVRASVRPAPRLSERLARDVRLVTGMKVDGSIVLGRRRLSERILEALLNRPP